jgi:hypothetical protein
MRFVAVLISLLTLCMARSVPTLTGIWVLETQKSQCVRAEVLTKLALSIEPLGEPGAFRLMFHPAERL